MPNCGYTRPLVVATAFPDIKRDSGKGPGLALVTDSPDPAASGKALLLPICPTVKLTSGADSFADHILLVEMDVEQKYY